MDLHFDFVTDEPGRHGVTHFLNPDRTGRTDPAMHLIIFAQACGRQRLHRRQLLRQFVLAATIGSVQHRDQEHFIRRFGLEIATATQQQMLPQSPLQMPIARLDIPVLIGTTNANCFGDHSVMLT